MSKYRWFQKRNRYVTKRSVLTKKMNNIGMIAVGMFQLFVGFMVMIGLMFILAAIIQ